MNGFPSREEVERVRKMYPIGSRIRLIQMKTIFKMVFVLFIALAASISFAGTVKAATTDQLIIVSGRELTVELKTFDDNNNLVTDPVPAVSIMDWEMQYAPSFVFDEYTKDGGRVKLQCENVSIGDGREYAGYCFYSDFHIISTLSGKVLWHEVSHYIFETTNQKWTAEMWTEFENLKSVYADVYNEIDTCAYFGAMDSEFFARLSSYLYVESREDFCLTPECGLRYEVWNAPGGERELHERGRAFLDSAYDLLR